MRKILSSLLILFLSGCAYEHVSLDHTTQYILNSTKDMGFEQKVDFVRQYVSFNTVQADYDYVMPRDEYRLLEDLYQAHVTGLPANLKCGYRSYIMIYLLKELGIKSREVGIWTDRPLPGDNGHSLVEVLNPNTDAWEVSDPTYNVYYITNGHRASLYDIIIGFLNNITPSDNVSIGWNIVNHDHTYGMNVQQLRDRHMLGVAVYKSIYRLVVINSARYDKTTIYPDYGMTMPQYYQQPQFNYTIETLVGVP